MTDTAAAGDAIVLKGLTKTYGSNVGVENIDFRVHQGEIMGFLGANGAGKTTTLRCIVGLLRPSGGSLRVLGRDPRTEHKQVLEQIGYLPGELRLYEDLTGEQHLELVADLQSASTARRGELCERLGLSSRDLKRPIRDYSRGMKQKIGLVQAFQHEPAVVILDEPTEGLDPLVQQSFFTLLTDEQARGCTVLLSSHIMSEVQRICERAAIIKRGHLLATDSVEALRSAHSRKLRVKFSDDFDKSSIALDEAMNPQWNGEQLVLSVNPDEVVQTLRDVLAFPVVDVTVEEAGLDEAMLDFYEGDLM